MHALVPEKNRKPGVCYAITDDRIELPVVDVTHPAFALDLTPENLRAIREREVRERKEWENLPRWLQGLLWRITRRRSVLMMNLQRGSGTFLPGMSTYLMKLGPDNLGEAYIKALDRRVAGRAPMLDVRWRLQAMAQLLAHGLAESLIHAPDGPITILNIAGGPTMDSLNALIVFAKHQPDRLRGRKITVHVLDGDTAGPNFGGRALQALRAEGAPLQGYDVELRHSLYDWHRTESLAELLRIDNPDTLTIGSSEGGLFQYGTEATIRANLETLHRHTPPYFSMVGSYSPDVPQNREMRRFSRFQLHFYSPTAFAENAQRAGWVVKETIEGPRTNCVRLVKQP